MRTSPGQASDRDSRILRVSCHTSPSSSGGQLRGYLGVTGVSWAQPPDEEPRYAAKEGCDCHWS